MARRVADEQKICAFFNIKPAEKNPGIRCLFEPWIREGKKSGSGSGSRILDEQPYFRELRNNFLS
jgi:hypothetical protein